MDDKWKPIGKFDETEDDLDFLDYEEEEEEYMDEAERVGFSKTMWGWM